MIGVFILSVGQETEELAINSIKEQGVPSLTVINIKPVNKAINICFKLAEDYGWEYFMIMGADTVHYKNSLAIMWKYMKKDVWCVYGRLNDYYRGSDSYGNHLYNMNIMKGYRVDEENPMYDHKIHADMEERGFKKAITKEVIGKHHPVWTVQEAFEKHLHSGKRYEDKYFRKYFKQVEKRYKENPCEVNRAARIGFQLGIGGKAEPLTNKETKEWKNNKKNFKIKDKLVW